MLRIEEYIIGGDTMALFKEGSQLDPMIPSSFLGFCGRNIGISTQSYAITDRRCHGLPVVCPSRTNQDGRFA